MGRIGFASVCAVLALTGCTTNDPALAQVPRKRVTLPWPKRAAQAVLPIAMTTRGLTKAI